MRKEGIGDDSVEIGKDFSEIVFREPPSVTCAQENIRSGKGRQNRHVGESFILDERRSDCRRCDGFTDHGNFSGGVIRGEVAAAADREVDVVVFPGGFGPFFGKQFRHKAAVRGADDERRAEMFR